jgi:DNA-binding MarR family transcriptional regulator
MLLLLEQRGLVVRHPHPTDARARTVALTAKGRRVYQKLWAVGEPIRESLVAAFEPAEREAFFIHLGRVTQALDGTGDGEKGAGAVNGGPEPHEGSVP